MKNIGWVKNNPLQWSRINPTYPLSIPHNLLSSSHQSNFIELEINVEIKLSFIGGVNEYQWRLIRIIEDFRRQSWTYKEISEYLDSQGYTSTRGKPISPPLVERMYKKYLKKLDNESIKKITIEQIKS